MLQNMNNTYSTNTYVEVRAAYNAYILDESIPAIHHEIYSMDGKKQMFVQSFYVDILIEPIKHVTIHYNCIYVSYIIIIIVCILKFECYSLVSTYLRAYDGAGI